MVKLCAWCGTKTIAIYAYRSVPCLKCGHCYCGGFARKNSLDKYSKIFTEHKCKTCGQKYYHSVKSTYCSKECHKKNQIYNKDVTLSPYYELKKKNNFECQACHKKFGSPNKYLHTHHIHPKFLGGDDSFDNIIILCSTCHLLAHKKLSRPY